MQNSDLSWGFSFFFFATFSNISAISWRPVLVVEEAGENHRPWASKCSTLLLAAASRVRKIPVLHYVTNDRKDWVDYILRMHRILNVTDMKTHSCPTD